MLTRYIFSAATAMLIAAASHAAPARADTLADKCRAEADHCTHRLLQTIEGKTGCVQMTYSLTDAADTEVFHAPAGEKLGDTVTSTGETNPDAAFLSTAASGPKGAETRGINAQPIDSPLEGFRSLNWQSGPCPAADKK